MAADYTDIAADHPELAAGEVIADSGFGVVRLAVDGGQGSETAQQHGDDVRTGSGAVVRAVTPRLDADR